MLVYTLSLLFLTASLFPVAETGLPKYVFDYIQRLTDEYDKKCISQQQTWASAITPQDALTSGSMPSTHQYLLPVVIIWDPMLQLKSFVPVIPCPRDGAQMKSYRWHNTDDKRRNPRRLYGLRGSVFLVAREYACSKCSCVILSSSEYVLQQLPNHYEVPFQLTQSRAGFTRELSVFVCMMLCRGYDLAAIEMLVKEHSIITFQEKEKKYWTHAVLYSHLSKESRPDFYFPENWQDPLVCQEFPSDDALIRLTLATFKKMKPTYDQHMSTLSANWISCDHTFKVAVNVGINRPGTNTWEKQYNCLFLVLNEIGQVISWKLGRSQSFEEIKSVLMGLKRRIDRQQRNLQFFIIDNCCAWRNKLQGVFSKEVPVLLDLFHAVQRVTKTISQRHPFKSAFLKDFRNVFRQPGDFQHDRKLSTPEPSVLLTNIQYCVSKYKEVKSLENDPLFRKETFVAVENLKKHIEFGCLSGIPVGAGTSRNENLHRHLNNAGTKIPHMTPLLFIAKLTLFLVRWNRMMRKKHNTGKKKPEPMESFELENEIKKLKNTANNSLSTEEPTHEQFGLSNEILNNVSVPDAGWDKHSISQAHLSIGPLQECLDNLNAEDDESCNEATVIKAKLTPVVNNHCLQNCLENLKTIPQEVYTKLLQKCHHFTDTVSTMPDMLSRNIHKYGFRSVDVLGDGNCLMTSIAITLQQFLSSEETRCHLQAVGLSDIGDIQLTSIQLREAMVNEWLTNPDKYCITDNVDDFKRTAELFYKPGTFEHDIGDSMPLALSNVLQIPLLIITSFTNVPVIPIYPDINFINVPLYLSYDASAAGHYNALVEKEDTNLKRNVDVKSSVNHSFCKCGYTRKSQEPYKQRCKTNIKDKGSKCPCLNSGKACNGNCKCYNCSNPRGTKTSKDSITIQSPLPKQKLSLAYTAGVYHAVDALKASSLNEVEKHILEVIIEFCNNKNKLTDREVFCLYNKVVKAPVVQLQNLQVAERSEKQIRNYLKYRRANKTLQLTFIYNEISESILKALGSTDNEKDKQ